MNMIKSYLKNKFYIDVRSAALFRIFLALANIVCAIEHLRFYEAFSNQGIQPRSMWADHIYYWSVFDLFDSTYWNYSLFILIIVFSVLIIRNFQAKLFFFLLLIITISLENRYIVSGGTVGLRLGLLWGLFLPISAVTNPFKLKFEIEEPKVTSIATVCFFLKIWIFYWAAFFNKEFYDWAYYSTALYNSLWWGGVATRFGEVIRMFPDLTKWLTREVFFLEFAAPLMILSGYKNGILRLFGVTLLLMMHAGIQFSMDLEEFPYANFAIALAFLPTCFWSYLSNQKFSDGIESCWKFSKKHLIIVVILVCVIWKNFNNYRILGPYPKPVVAVLNILKINERWGMFSGGGEYLTFWPAVKAETKSGKIFDIWKWYLGYKDTSFTDEMPEHPSDLTPNLRWEKFITNITLNRGIYGGYQEPFLNFLCQRYNATNEDPVVRVSLNWGWRHVVGIETFNNLGFGELRTVDCMEPK